MEKKTLLLTADANAYYFNRIDIENLDICSVFPCSTEKHGVQLKFLRRINSALTRFYYNYWYKCVNEYTKIIVTDNVLAFDIRLLENIRRRAPKSECYIYSWNIVKNVEKHKRLMGLAEKTGFKFFCYDKGECERYSLNFNTIMYDKSLKIPEKTIQYDTFFLGFLKDRKDKMLKLHNAMKKGGINPRFVIVGKKEEEIPFEFHEKYISYYEYLDMLSQSRSILDIAQNGQDGYSMRVMEAIFLNKKLITTNKYVRDSIFYDENNILIIDLDDINHLKIREFFQLEFHPYSETVRDYYSFEKWIDRFE